MLHALTNSTKRGNARSPTHRRRNDRLAVRGTKKLDIADRVVFMDWLPAEKEMNEVLASADIGLVMRIGQETDHFHMTDTFNHETACRKPILAVHLKGISEFIEDG